MSQERKGSQYNVYKERLELNLTGSNWDTVKNVECLSTNSVCLSLIDKGINSSILLVCFSNWAYSCNLTVTGAERI